MRPADDGDRRVFGAALLMEWKPRRAAVHGTYVGRYVCVIGRDV